MNKKFENLYNIHFASLCEVAYKIVKDSDQAREIVQDVFVDFWRKRDAWHAIVSPKAYLVASVYNRSLNSLRQRKKLVSLTHDARFEYNSAEESINTDDLLKCLAEGIDLLPEKCKTIFLLSREEEMTYAEIAAHLAISIKTVENQMGIALKKLRGHLERSNQFPKKIILSLL